MPRHLVITLLTLSWIATAAAQTPVTTADFAGTWNIEFMSHQIALVIEAKDTTHVTATMMMMGRDVPLKGELKDRTLTLVGDRDATTASQGSGAAPSHQGEAGAQAPAPRPITVTLQEDGTISGEMMTTRGPGTWTGERLRKRK